MVVKRYKRNIKKEKRIAKRKSMALANKINKRHKKISSKIGNCQARPIGEINLPISRKYERAIKFLRLLTIIMRKFFILLSVNSGDGPPTPYYFKAAVTLYTTITTIIIQPNPIQMEEDTHPKWKKMSKAASIFYVDKILDFFDSPFCRYFI